jgi:alpha-glucosidase
MYFNKFPHPSNFRFVDSFHLKTGTLLAGDETFQTRLDYYRGDLVRVRIYSEDRWQENPSLVQLTPPALTDKPGRITVQEPFEIVVVGRRRREILRSAKGVSFGVSGKSSLFQFTVGKDAQFFGMGQKFFGRMELSGVRTKFSNTDVWSDFHFGQWGGHPSDPPYFSTPYVIVRVGSDYAGLLLHNPAPTFMEIPGNDTTRVFVEWQRTSDSLILGSELGQPDLWILVGPSLPELTQKLQRLIGTTPLPPMWSLGYHQSRYGYQGHAELVELSRNFELHQIPCDGLWMDLESMDGFRVFSICKKAFPKGVLAASKELSKHDRKLVAILDPGVKKEAGYALYDEGLAAGHYCVNPEGEVFTGMVWPGETVFPDFTQEATRHWWRDHTSAWAGKGFAGAWIDMNDPSTGPVDPSGMLFRSGMDSHALHRNQYALGMQMATHDGLQQVSPNMRPFLLSRSGFVGSSRYSAIWSGDNVSNRFYLKNSVPCALGMSLSGLPFNGADIGGFGGDCDADLMVDWVKSSFLFPFFRNHSKNDSRRQEPFAYGSRDLGIIRRYIRLRYKLLPYLYGLFIDQEELGEPMLRPLFYDWDSPELTKIDDQFMVGPSILQAPFLDDVKVRSFVLPGIDSWYDARSGVWVQAGEHHTISKHSETPLFLKAGSLLPMQPGTPRRPGCDLRRIQLHVFVPPKWSGTSTLRYRSDDGVSYDYRKGKRSELAVGLASVDGQVALSIEQTSYGFGPIEWEFVVHGRPESLRLNGVARDMVPGRTVLTGGQLPVVRV